ncbi:serine--tRNA ligase [Sphingomonas oryzagri]|uniref:Serine--tRNA ligase n=1 Tax=Sphingomonas oryzagri TaxID=3042314 RepID=A0ABT6MXP7_9SPHN|nr:serine--tRNA ligase [Sphingomonas oryzagri]MDH7637824.1 serine--tRNA ligase [Sphingomonas oryzagri]
MHDIRLIRDDPAAFDAGLAKRGVAPQSADLLALDERRRQLLTDLQVAQASANAAAKAIGALIGQGKKDEAEAQKAEVAALKTSMPKIEAEAAEVGTALDAQLAGLPNLPYPEVPEGADEDGNVVVKTWGEPAAFDFAAKEHDELGKALGMDFDAAGTVSGARFVYLKGGLARLNRALSQFMLDMQTGTHGYTEVVPPVLVRDAAMFGTGQLPKFAEDLFQTTDGRWLIPTAEVSLTNYVQGQILAETELPIRFTALTNCFRAEAGAAGRDTRGIIRQHQFEKVELVSIVAPEQSEDEHERMTLAAESVLEALGLPYRRMLLCTGDMGFTAKRTFDLEVWLPGQQRYREISSCSTCGDFQARRMNARYRPAGETKGTRFVHTLNGSGLAVGRTLVAVMENYQTMDGAIRVPDALRPYMNGIEAVEPA